jgi:GTP-binding protein
MSLTIAIIGRPNVGKSTLFNRLVGRKIAIVDPTPGVTRDRRTAKGSIADLEFDIIDTAGMEEAMAETIESEMMKQTTKAVKQADVLLLLIDAKDGITPMDEFFAKWVRKLKTPIILVANKCEGKGSLSSAAEAYSLGMGDPVMISAEHGEGLHDLYSAIKEYQPEEIDDEIIEEEIDPKEIMNIAIVGRPNVGKSTLLNKLLGEERSIVGSKAGTTRDSISVLKEYDGRQLKIVDTAGMRRKSNITENIEKMSIGETIHALQFAHIVVLVLDGTVGLDKQDLTIAELVIKEGRGLIIAINKWDIVTDRYKKLEDIQFRLEKSLPQAKGVPIIRMSAKTGKNTTEIFEDAFNIYAIWNKRISTGQLNSWLKEMEEQHSPPLVRGRRLRLRYMTQASARPPRFALFTNFVKEFPESYLRYLTNHMREDFGLHGVPIRIFPRKKENPFDK